ncbi:MAG: XrtN system VIT domain-containing protein [Fulvivirga sp.]
MKKHIILGLLLVAVSAILFAIEVHLQIESNSNPFGDIFFIHYIMAVVYFFIVKYNEKYFWRFFQKENLAPHTILLVLFNISAYSLNRSLPIFNESSDWLTVFLIIENSLLILFVLVEKPNNALTTVVSFFMPIALIFNLYQSFMVLPGTPFGIVGVLFLGLSLLLFVPFFYVVCISSLLRSINWSRFNKLSALLGTLIIVIIVTTFCIKWSHTESKIHQTKLDQDAPFVEDYDLPEWVVIAQLLDSDPLTEKYLKTGLVYQEFTDYAGDGFSTGGLFNYDEKRIHDPLISIASLFSNSNALDNMTRIKILNYLYDSRHQSSDRFWSGENLKTKSIVTNIELFPEERLSFTEKIITIQNTQNKRRRWGNQQEALYTFDLPDGGVVTSLSLWIEGQESKGILTSKKKAVQAYNTIVGREVRDPSVVYWMEGNQIRVRVFPCTPQEDRKFKIGISAPLKLTNHHLAYNSIQFKGPDFSNAEEAIYIVTRNAKIIESEISLEETEKYLSWRGDHKQNWSLTIEVPNISSKVFSFNNEHFRVEKTNTRSIDMQPKRIYLDISNAWTSAELKAVEDITKGYEIIVFSTSFDRKSSSEDLENIEKSTLPTFTLFPFHKINPDNSIIITKGGKATPNLSDLIDSPFRDQLFNYLNKQASPPLVLDIGIASTYYLQSLKEFGVIDYQQMNLDELSKAFETRRFPSRQTDLNITTIPQNGLSIKRLDNLEGEYKTAPDHLMRLFYYQQVLHNIGKHYFSKDKNDYIENEIVDKAALANIVTPVSSLIVLETQADYDRFGIDKKKDSLGNASIGNDGAVPEPHEWAMIIFGIGLLLFMYWRNLKSTQAI